MIERPLTGFQLVDAPTQQKHAFVLANPHGYIFTLAALATGVLRITLTGPDRPPPPHSNVTLNGAPIPLASVENDARLRRAVLRPPPDSSSQGGRGVPRYEIHIDWEDTIVLEIFQLTPGAEPLRIFGDTPHKSYCLNHAGITRHTRLDVNSLHLGLGEKGAPIDLSNRRFTITGSDAAGYDAYLSDPLYKHTPFLVSIPKPLADDPTDDPTDRPLRAAVGLYHASNSDATWDVGKWINEPWTLFKKFEQECGGLEEYIIIGDGLSDVVAGFADLVGRPKLVPRDWLGYLASGMGLGESDEPIAQELLSGWPELCKKWDIPCSAIHLSSGYTVDEKGNRCVFTMNTRRYPDFAEMCRVFHRAGMKVTPNVKPYVLEDHPDFKKLHDAGALFTDPSTGKAVVTRIWSSLPGINAKGSWVDLTSQAGQDWWRDGILGLVDLGVDAIWNDNNEFLLFDDEYICKNNSANAPNAVRGPIKLGLVGRMTNTEMMAKVSHDALLARHPDRRPFVLTRSANVGTMRYAASTWSGDNRTCWKSLQGAVAMNLNAQLSLMQSYGSDVGGFAGPLPSPELFVRWVQMGVTHPRFCIHSFKPNEKDPSGSATNNLPWMYPEVVDIIRNEIKRRYELLPFFNNLNWQSHLRATPPNTWLGWGEFATDPTLYSKEILDGFDYWLGHGQLLVCGAYFAEQVSRRVYLPRTSKEDTAVYYDLHEPYGVHAAGSWLDNVSTPLEHFAMFAREGTALPIGRDSVTLTQRSGPAIETGDGVKVRTVEEGGLATYDDWRGLEVFPSPPGATGREYVYRWIEDDGVSENPETAAFEVQFGAEADTNSVRVAVKVEAGQFKPLWLPRVWIALPVGDDRSVSTAVEVTTWKSRKVYAIDVA
ncbi:uncharacterized protein PFL1_06810 [Pseudozyma flocculosa PF-1]|uniref:Related to alpha-glucosidase n=2 Tax=Pseudozyma flocculosa TaxID=84751 RepID=A0A5C3F558_9BASI|nr:uncharacterized protein PFL1_06810 [Pseudozyma flocculosa PF-1]EPQ25630.1 hypothetical protein PFL1_06810 [Pseudozyma flocculosa PF-1]SPO38549.1 related to alpha-glucosidase [Pseudozyma flocculosa]